ncbi:2'-5' RNA ligase family protein [Clostridium sp. D2Q-11]|uniref:2'-5' RNA ligase family protein n=1 Tax=Anaeromonas frigoriresistens TaxID=2683708 RepID=A0A942UXX5_9FIRM|nr:2'-5' RNA ligase family protein [Anaeromonas frigoriresistens]MBS4537642.1 2'-5' RNA ligase family protein [Anaeromonas frigoriresistens]
MKKRSIIIFVDFPNVEIIQEIRKKYDPLYECIRPHITLLFPFESDITSGELKNHMENVLDDIEPFNITLRDITGAGDNYLFLNLKKGNDEIIELHDRLYSGILEKYLYKRLTYIPHITVGHLDAEDNYIKALEEVVNVKDEFKMIVKEIAVEVIDENENSNIEFIVGL